MIPTQSDCDDYRLEAQKAQAKFGIRARVIVPADVLLHLLEAYEGWELSEESPEKLKEQISDLEEDNVDLREEINDLQDRLDDYELEVSVD